MRRGALGIAWLLPALACARDADSVVVVKVEGPAIFGVVRLGATFSNGGVADQASFPAAPSAAPIVFPTQFAVTLPRARQGALDVALEGHDAAGAVVAHGAKRVTIVPGGRAEGTIALSPGRPACGNRQRDPGEQCDDGNRASGDGCDFLCQQEIPPARDAAPLDASPADAPVASEVGPDRRAPPAPPDALDAPMAGRLDGPRDALAGEPGCQTGVADCADAGVCDVNLLSDPRHCGRCGRACSATMSCYAGECLTTCDDTRPFPMPSASCINVAPTGVSYSASRAAGVAPPRRAADRNLCTEWNAGAFAEQWWQVSFAAPVTVSGVAVVPSIQPNGTVSFRVETSDDGMTFATQLMASQGMSHRGMYSFPLPAPAQARHVRLRTTGAPSWVAWFEIAIFSCP